ncbi:MAG: hypothetical protein HOQ24_04460 [Mycobacteriaceae bacterium]|nr:hypothetical protein [Mycobacteriaceae bacterium]
MPQTPLLCQAQQDSSSELGRIGNGGQALRHDRRAPVGRCRRIGPPETGPL